MLIRLNTIDIPLDRDEGIFGYAGQVILNHGLPYRDVFEHKPPLVFYIYALALIFVSPTPSGIHIFLQVYNFITLISLFFLAKVYSKSSSAGYWTAFIYAMFSASPVIQGFTASAENFMLLPITLSLLFAVLAVQKNNLVFSFISGFAGALACWTKQTAAFSVLFVLLYLLAGPLSQKSGDKFKTSKRLFRLTGSWAAGAAAVSMSILLYFYFNGVFDEFIYWCFTHNWLYSGLVSSSDKWAMFFSKIISILKEDVVLIALGIFYGFYSLLKKDGKGLFISSFAIFSFLGAVPGPAYTHYFAQIAPALSLAAGFGVLNLIHIVPSRPAKNLIIIAAAILILFVPPCVNPGYYFKQTPAEISRSIFGDNPFPESRVIAKYIEQNSGPNDRVFIFGSEPQILLYARRKSATSYVTMYPLMNTSYPRYMEFQKRAWQEINRVMPEYIVSVPLHTSHLWDGRADLFLFRELQKLVHSAYHVDSKMTLETGEGHLIGGSDLDKTNDPNHVEKNTILLYRKNQ